jgi:hypothetical protein
MFLGSVLRLIITANIVPSSPILVTLMVEALSSCETSVLTRVPRRNIPDDGIIEMCHSYRKPVFGKRWSLWPVRRRFEKGRSMAVSLPLKAEGRTVQKSLSSLHPLSLIYE